MLRIYLRICTEIVSVRHFDTNVPKSSKLIKIHRYCLHFSQITQYSFSGMRRLHCDYGLCVTTTRHRYIVKTNSVTSLTSRFSTGFYLLPFFYFISLSHLHLQSTVITKQRRHVYLSRTYPSLS